MTDANRPLPRLTTLYGTIAVVLACLTVVTLTATAVENPGHPRMGAPRADLVRGNDAATEFVVRFPVSLAPVDWESVQLTNVDWGTPGERALDDQGREIEIPRSHGAVIALPARRVPRVEVAGWSWLREPSTAVDVLSQVDVGAVQILRGVPIVSVHVRPETPGGGLLGEVRLIVRHGADGAGREALTAAAAKGEPERPASGRNIVVNPELFQKLHDGHATRRLTEVAAKDGENHPFLLSDHWLRLEIAETGVYRLTGNNTASSGINNTAVDPTTMRLFRAWPGPLAVLPEDPGSWQEDWHGLTEAALDLDGVSASWNTGDELRFYAVGPDAWADRTDPEAGRLAWDDHLYSNVVVYWLTWEDFGTATPFAGAPLRLATSAATPRGVTPETTHMKRRHLEEQVVEAHGRLLDSWAWSASLVYDRTIDFSDAAAVAGQPAFFSVELRTQVMNYSQSLLLNTASAHLNTDEANAAVLSWTGRQEADSLHVHVAGWSNSLRNGQNSLVIERTNTTNTPILMLDSIDLLYGARLETDAQTSFVHWGEQVTAADTDVDLRLATNGVTTVWDVSDALQPVRLAGATDASGTTLGLVRAPDSDRHFIAFAESDLMTPPARTLRTPGVLRSLDRDLDYVIIHATEFSAAARVLGAYRATSLPGIASPSVAVVDVADVFDAFGGGVRDPMALRNFLKWVWNGSDGRFAQVCLLGDASRDYRNHRNIFGDLLPTWVWNAFPALMYPGSHTNLPYATDDVLVGFDDPGQFYTFDTPDLMSGRLTVQNAAEANRRVAEIISYGAQPEAGTWRNRIVMAADDMKQPSSDENFFETAHTRQAEELIDTYVPLTLDVHKVYLVDYEKPAGVNYKPAARQRARAEWNDGLTMFHYIGHGADNTLADEQLFLTEDIYGLSNGMKRGLFLAFSCDVGIFDQVTKQSMAETWTAQQEGAAIAAIAASQVSYISANNMLSDRFYAALFPDRLVDPTVTPARALWEAKVWIGANSYDFNLSNALRYLFHGDPATLLPHAVGGPEFHASSADSLRGGRREVASLVLSDHGLSVSPGMSYDLLVQESRDDRSAYAGASTTLRWWRPGAAVFHGTGPVDSDTLRVPFKVPLQLRYGEHGKVRLIVNDDDGDRVAAETLWVAQAATGVIDDAVGPAIDLGFTGDRYRVKAGTVLTAALADTSGISIVGSNPLNSVQLEFDGDGRLVNVSDTFAFDPGSYTTGRVSYPLPNDLEIGRHEVAMYASDVLGNVGSDTLSFMLVADSASGIEDVTVFPNPTVGPTRLLFEISDPMTVTWTLYTLSGHRVIAEREYYPDAGPQILHWDGRDDQGDEIANGVYLYVLRGTLPDGDGHAVVVSGQLVMMK